jgi:hypothetical protein
MKYYPVPVLCAQEAKTKGMFKGYLDDQKSIAKSAGDALSALVGAIPDHFFPKKSLLLDSMGNYDVFNGACENGTPEIEFENIYMVAAVSCLFYNFNICVFSSKILILSDYRMFHAISSIKGLVRAFFVVRQSAVTNLSKQIISGECSRKTNMVTQLEKYTLLTMTMIF